MTAECTLVGRGVGPNPSVCIEGLMVRRLVHEPRRQRMIQLTVGASIEPGGKDVRFRMHYELQACLLKLVSRRTHGKRVCGHVRS